MSEKRQKKPKSKVRKILEWTFIGIIGALFVVVAAGTIDAKVHEQENFGQPIRFGTGSFLVLTNSMEPEYKVNSAIITYKKDPNVIYNDWASGKNVDITFYDAFGASNSFTTPTKTGSQGVPKTNRTTLNRSSKLPMVITHRVFDIHVDESKAVGEGRYYFFLEGINEDAATTFGASDQYQVITESYMLGVVILNSPALGAVFQFVASPWGLFILLLIPALYLVISSMVDIVVTMKANQQEEGEKVVPASLNELSPKERERLKQEMLQQMLEKKQQERQQALEQQKPEEEAKPAEEEQKEPEEEKKEDEA